MESGKTNSSLRQSIRNMFCCRNKINKEGIKSRKRKGRKGALMNNEQLQCTNIDQLNMECKEKQFTSDLQQVQEQDQNVDDQSPSQKEIEMLGQIQKNIQNKSSEAIYSKNQSNNHKNETYCDNQEEEFKLASAERSKTQINEELGSCAIQAGSLQQYNQVVSIEILSENQNFNLMKQTLEENSQVYPIQKQIDPISPQIKDMFIGISNYGNTCYMNATIQCLINSQEFLDLSSKCSKTNMILQKFNQLCISNPNQKHQGNPQYQLISKIKSTLPEYANFEQKDAHAFLMDLLNLEDLLEEVSAKLFLGKMVSTYKCPKSEDHIYHVSEQYLSVQLPIQKNGSISKFIQDFQLPSEIDGWYCSECKATQDGFQQKMELKTNPQYLICQLLRFEFCPSTLSFRKIDVSVKVEEGLKVGDDNYKLNSVICHQGSLYSGHYTAFCYKESKQCWYYFNDSNIEECASVEQVLKMINKIGYILIFKKIEEQ